MSKNATKTNEVVTVKTVYDVFVKSVGSNVCKLNFSDAKSQPYCGFDDFSVNMKKSSFNVYMSTANATICTTVDSSLVTEVNASDNTKKQLRNTLIRFTDFEVLKKCIIAVAKNRFATATETK